MAFPAFQAGNGTNFATAATSFAINVGSPSAGNLLLVYIRFAGAPGTQTFTGYTVFAGPDASDASDDSNTIYYRWTDGTEGATDTLTTVNSVKAAAVSFVISGTENPATQPPETSTVAVGTGANADSTIVTPTGGAKDYMWMVTLGLDSETATATQPTGYDGTRMQSANSGTGGAVATNCMVWMTFRTANAASEDPGAWTSSAPANGWTAWTVAIPPPTVATFIEAPALQALQAVSRASVY